MTGNVKEFDDTEQEEGADAGLPLSSLSLDAVVSSMDTVEDVDEAPVRDQATPSDDMRTLLVGFTFILLIATVLLAFFTAWFCTQTTWERIESLLHTIIPVETLVLGAAVSYYFKTDQG